MAWEAPSRTAEAYSPPRSRLTAMRSGCWRIQAAAVFASRSGKRSTTRQFSKFTSPRVAQRACRGSDPWRKRPLKPCAHALGGEQEHHPSSRSEVPYARYRRDGRLRIQTSAEDRLFEKRARREKFFSCPHAMLAKASNVRHVEPSREETRRAILPT